MFFPFVQVLILTVVFLHESNYWKSVAPGRIKKRAAHSENFLGGLVCTRNLAFRLQ